MSESKSIQLTVSDDFDDFDELCYFSRLLKADVEQTTHPEAE